MANVDLIYTLLFKANIPAATTLAKALI